MGLWHPVRMGRYRRDRWEGLTESAATIGYATALSLELYGEALVVRREFATSPQIHALIELVRRRLEPYCARFPEIWLVG